MGDTIDYISIRTSLIQVCHEFLSLLYWCYAIQINFTIFCNSLNTLHFVWLAFWKGRIQSADQKKHIWIGKRVYLPINTFYCFLFCLFCCLFWSIPGTTIAIKYCLWSCSHWHSLRFTSLSTLCERTYHLKMGGAQCVFLEAGCLLVWLGCVY